MTATELNPGVYQGLARTSGDGGVFTIVAFDQRDSYRKMLPDANDVSFARQLKLDVVEALSPSASAVLLDPEYGQMAALKRSRHAGLLMALEKSGYSGDASYRRTELYSDWTVGDIKRFGADAVKLLVYYHPHSGSLAEELEDLCSRVGAWAAEAQLAYFLEPVLYSIDPSSPKDSPEFAALRPGLVAETAARLSRCGAQVLKLEFPVDHAHDKDQGRWAEACRSVSEASEVPWALLSAGVNYEVFERQVEVACRNGASGFLGGRAIWKEAVRLRGPELASFLSVTARERLERLRVVAEAYGRPWKEWYVPKLVHPPT